jgi:tetratricopeptide (TPR) repeat protein
VSSYNKAISINPDFAEAYSNLGLALKELGQLDEAVESYNKALFIKPNYAEAHNNIANVFQKHGQFDKAVESYNKALGIEPDYAEAHYNLGNALKELGNFDEAVASYKKTIAIKPDYAEVYSNLGVVHQELGMPNDAISSYDKAISIKPDFAESYWNKSLSLLLCGEFKTGWELYEWRWKKKSGKKFEHNRSFSQPLWLGVEALKDKTILLHSEQGFGDTIQFCRYAKLVKALGARVILEIPKPLLSLLQGLEGADELIEDGKPLPHFDYHCPLMSLPLAFKTELNTIPSPTSYFKSDSNKVAKWRDRLGEKTAPRIGLVWNGRAEHTNDHNRSLTLATLTHQLPDHFEYVCLQNEIRDTDQEALKKSSIKYFGAEINDFTETQALCEVMDLVISVDTCMAHLSGALGKPTWVILPYSPDWRWLLDRDDSPWYVSVKLHRQCEGRNWGPVLQCVVKDLINLTQ